jgi:Tol biopolymer transport system component
MKIPMRFLIPIVAALLLTLGLSNCGSGHELPFVTATTSFVYLQDTSTGPAPSIAHHPGSLSQARAALLTREHVATKRLANTSVDIGTGHIDLYVMDTSTGTTTKLVSGGEFYNALLSYDGTKLVVSAADTSGYSQIYLADAKFETITQLTSDKSDHYDVALSADGTMITYDNDYNKIFTIPATGGTPTLIPTTLNEAWGPVFTPDGKKVVFSGWNGSHTYVYGVNLDGTGLTQLSIGTVWDGLPSVSHDGTLIAFERDGTEGESEDIAVISSAGETTANPGKVLTTNGKSWQPEFLGNKILYLSWAGSTNYLDKIYEMNTDGTGVVQLTNSTMEDDFNWWYWD